MFNHAHATFSALRHAYDHTVRFRASHDVNETDTSDVAEKLRKGKTGEAVGPSIVV